MFKNVLLQLEKTYEKLKNMNLSDTDIIITCRKDKIQQMEYNMFLFQ